MKDTRTQIIDLAEEMIRARGYNGFSFRDIATEIGIKSASVHHHFPTKESLALAVAQRYSENFFHALGKAPDAKNPGRNARHYAKIFREAFRNSGKACLCGMLSHEAALLTPELRKEIESFVEKNMDWLSTALKQPNEKAADTLKKARLIYTALEGAMGVSALTQKQDWIDSVAEITAKAILKT